MESFSANYYCRTCLTDKASAQTVFNENDPRVTFCNVSDNFVFDIMHDILEGVAQYETKLLFEYLNKNFIMKTYSNVYTHATMASWIKRIVQHT